MEIRYLGDATFELRDGDTTVLIALVPIGGQFAMDRHGLAPGEVHAT